VIRHPSHPCTNRLLTAAPELGVDNAADHQGRGSLPGPGPSQVDLLEDRDTALPLADLGIVAAAPRSPSPARARNDFGPLVARAGGRTHAERWPDGSG
jgi:hypothetical protein